MPAQNWAQSQVDMLNTMLMHREVGKIEILQIPGRILTRTSITPELLERQFHYRLTIRDVRSGVYQKSVIEAMKSVIVRPGAGMPDLRWGVIFYRLDDSRIVAIYFDGSGNKGAVGDTPVSVKGDLSKWLKDNFSSCFR